LVANAHKLTNLIFVIDRNQFQANMATEDLIPLEPMVDKFVAFGMQTQRVNGHDFVQLAEAFEKTNSVPGPHVIICDTVRGKGLPSIEARSDRWFCNFSAGEIQSLMDELHQISQATLTAETLVVR
jgi:transketolase